MLFAGTFYFTRRVRGGKPAFSNNLLRFSFCIGFAFISFTQTAAHAREGSHLRFICIGFVLMHVRFCSARAQVTPRRGTARATTTGAAFRGAWPAGPASAPTPTPSLTTAGPPDSRAPAASRSSRNRSRSSSISRSRSQHTSRSGSRCSTSWAPRGPSSTRTRAAARGSPLRS